jgi:hypothetical protein
MTQHTQGEWVVSDARMAPGGICGRYIAHTDGSRIAEAFFNCRVNAAEELEANARLIAAAPALLAALSAIMNSVPFHHSHKTAHDAARAAIAKATGSAA